MWQTCGIPENVPRFLKSVFHIPDKLPLELASLVNALFSSPEPKAQDELL